VLGQKDLLMSAWQASSPHPGPGRDDKIGKEEILGMLAAVEAWVIRDHDQEWQNWLEILRDISAGVTRIAGVTAQISEAAGLSNRAPSLTISWDPAALHINGEQVAEDFARNSPRIAVGSSDEAGTASIRITPSQMQPGNAAVVTDRVRAILSQTRAPRPSQLQHAGVDLSGTWDLAIEYFTSTSQQRLSIQQDGNWIEGIHQSDFSTQSLTGVVEGDDVKLHSVASKPGDTVPFLFSGTVNGDKIFGSIHLGEYLTAPFTASRSNQKAARIPITIPGGPPLAT